jgi:Asp-tRNA(Asn)/Glu-tRNA(Gln) amidotransferase A subunit family amidase
MKIINKSIDDLHRLLVKKEVSSTELTREFLYHIHSMESRYRLFHYYGR